VEIDCDGESLASGIALTARREEPRRSRCVRRERIRRAAADFEQIRELALGLRRPARVPCTPAQIDDLPPNPDRLRSVAGKVEAVTEPSERLHALRLLIACGPELKRATDDTRGVAVRMNGAIRLCGLEQERPGDLRSSRCERVGRDRLPRASSPALVCGPMPSRRARTASRTVSGSGTLSCSPSVSPSSAAVSRPAAARAAATSSTKNGTPWVRSQIAAARGGESSASRTAAASSAVSPASSGSTESSSSRRALRNAVRARRSA
jgi:hypothetical protein